MIVWRKKKRIEVERRVKEALANTQFRVELDIGSDVAAHVSGKMRKNVIRIIPGDWVKVEISPSDLGRVRITYRGRAGVTVRASRRFKSHKTHRGSRAWT